jgi:transcription elongation factor Elf1
MKLPSTFDCPICSTRQCVEVKMAYATHLATLKCRDCKVMHQMRINDLHAPVDVFADWIDYCDSVKKKQKAEASSSSSSAVGGDGGTRSASRLREEADDQSSLDEDDDAVESYR